MTEPDIANVVTIVALIVASLLISYLTAQHALKQARDHARDQLELRLGGLTDAIAELEARVAELARAPITRGAPEPAVANGATAQTQAKSDDEVPAEVLILITAAVTSFLGKQGPHPFRQDVAVAVRDSESMGAAGTRDRAGLA